MNYFLGPKILSILTFTGSYIHPYFHTGKCGRSSPQGSWISEQNVPLPLLTYQRPNDADKDSLIRSSDENHNRNAGFSEKVSWTAAIHSCLQLMLCVYKFLVSHNLRTKKIAEKVYNTAVSDFQCVKRMI